MTIAEIHGKSPLTTSEDFLTADVFTALRYLPADSGIVGFLRSIEGIGEIIPAATEWATAAFFFWPLGHTREPDVLIALEIDGGLYHVVVEAKYLSGPSDYEIVEVEQGDEIVEWGNQLADQFRDLLYGEYRVFESGKREGRKVLSSPLENRLLLYLTADPARPGGALRLSADLNPDSAGRTFWTNWRQVDDYLRDNRHAFSRFPYDRIVEDLLTLLELKRFIAFRGVRRPPLSLQERSFSGHFWTGGRR